MKKWLICNLLDEEIKVNATDYSKKSRTYKIDKNAFVFVNQLESYLNRGQHFINLSALEFECMIETKKCNDNDAVNTNNNTSSSGRKKE